MARTALATPREWWNHLDDEIGFTLDAAADHRHFMCTPYFTEEDDALEQVWTGRVWCSPPWAPEELYQWVKKGFEAAKSGTADVVVMLLPVRTNSDWWHDFVIHAHEIRFFDGSLKFEPFDERVISFHVEEHLLVMFWQDPLFDLGVKLGSYSR